MHEHTTIPFPHQQLLTEDPLTDRKARCHREKAVGTGAYPASLRVKAWTRYQDTLAEVLTCQR
jgi:hypothetical protein